MNVSPLVAQVRNRFPFSETRGDLVSTPKLQANICATCFHSQWSNWPPSTHPTGNHVLPHQSVCPLFHTLIAQNELSNFGQNEHQVHSFHLLGFDRWSNRLSQTHLPWGDGTHLSPFHATSHILAKCWHPATPPGQVPPTLQPKIFDWQSDGTFRQVEDQSCKSHLHWWRWRSLWVSFFLSSHWSLKSWLGTLPC